VGSTNWLLQAVPTKPSKLELAGSVGQRGLLPKETMTSWTNFLA
jgi:hypothetical protein